VEFSTLSLSPAGKLVFKVFPADELEALIKEEQAKLEKKDEPAAV
jgi:hypothetical protein